MKARFIGDPNQGGEGPALLPFMGVEFVKGEWAEVDSALFAKVSSNSHFEVDANEDGEADPSLDGLRASLDALGVKYHHKAGPAKLAELLANAQQ